MTFDLSHVISITTIFTIQVIIAIDHDYFSISRNQPMAIIRFANFSNRSPLHLRDCVNN